MSLASGTRLGPYEIVAQVGAGGMGEVYRATDTRLDRKVAIKVLPEHLASDSGRRERFEREARAVSSLNHPHICTLYDVGQQDRTHYLVMELVEGETLESRLRKGRLALDEALEYAVQIADALDKAHRQGVVHRDLKPGNIMLTKSGVKLLDFGLAKLRGKVAPAAGLSQVPTQDRSLTAEGTILGTLQYMAPEQLEGEDADSRTDIFAFGAVVYEMVTGKKAFEGKSQASLIGAIMNSEPQPMAELQEMTPRSLDHVVRRCLSKDPDVRWQSASDVMRETSWVADMAGSEQTGSSGSRRRVPLVWALILAGVATIAVGGATFLALHPVAVSRQVVRFSIDTPPEGPLTLSGIQTDVAISPDGTRMVYLAETGGERRLYVNTFADGSAADLRVEPVGNNPFFSVDSRRIGYWGGGRDASLRYVPVGGGSPTSIAESGVPLGVSWGDNDAIIFAHAGAPGLQFVSAPGARPEEVTTPDPDREEMAHRQPEILPGGHAVLFTIVKTNPAERFEIAALSLDTGTYAPLSVTGSNPHYSATGHIVYAAEGALWAVPFDADRLEVTGKPVRMIDQLIVKNSGAANFALSENGTLIYVSGSRETTRESALITVDRNGRETQVTPVTADYQHPRFSPDGRKLAVAIAEVQGNVVDSDADIAVIALDSGLQTSLTVSGDNIRPVWSPDGSRLAFYSGGSAGGFLYQVPADGSGAPEILFEAQVTPGSWTDKGLLYTTLLGDDVATNVGMIDSNGGPIASKFPAIPGGLQFATLSPDGQWLAYVAQRGGQGEVYVRPYSGGGEVQVSTGGGQNPVWANEGRELFYRSGNRIMLRRLESEAALSLGRPTVAFELGSDFVQTAFGSNYDISPDGQRLVLVHLINQRQQESARISVVLNWTQELLKRVPVD